MVGDIVPPGKDLPGDLTPRHRCCVIGHEAPAVQEERRGQIRVRQLVPKTVELVEKRLGRSGHVPRTDIGRYERPVIEGEVHLLGRRIDAVHWGRHGWLRGYRL